MQITVPADNFTNALAACAAHTFQGKDAGYLATVDLQMNESLELLATASGGSTTAVARIPLVELDGTMGRIALSKQDIGTIRSMFNDPFKQLEVTVRTSVVPPAAPDDKPERVHQLEIRELGSLFGGRSLKLTLADHGNRDVPGLWHPIAAALRRRSAPSIPVTLFNPKNMLAFRSASMAYGEELRIELADNFGSLIVHCGPYFVGFLHARAGANDIFTKNRAEWGDRLPMKLAAVKDGS
ncbi:hypothetical protein MB46_10310 [Arthrobacter alpinus]|uniref:hypothetical protein n=1 Tax=Arthrobacter alpinus TaxID=656366 RepID=UPI0005CB01AA|nr:hypothetical protein [Arthrobacter alpinus]ALV45813.1 hypothetical protein MB46_10310 [Arthrobacter alpinus]